MTCLSVSTDGSLLLSGSHDETVRLWDIQSKQCLKTMNHKGRHALISVILPSLSVKSCCCLALTLPSAIQAFLCCLFHPFGKGRGIKGMPSLSGVGF